MRCFSCKHFYYLKPESPTPYGEETCLKLDVDLLGTLSEDVANCPDYEEKEGLNHGKEKETH